LGGRGADLFFLGSLSLVDTMLDRSMDDVLAELPLGADLEAALLGESNLLRPVLEVAIAYERGCWEECDALALTLGLAKPTLSAVYVDGVQWAHDVFAA
jgi:EAL and modified HD-GYP domain-containing signal transduction protein